MISTCGYLGRFVCGLFLLSTLITLFQTPPVSENLSFTFSNLVTGPVKVAAEWKVLCYLCSLIGLVFIKKKHYRN